MVTMLSRVVTKAGVGATKKKTMVTMLSREVTKAGVGAKKKDYGHKLS